MTTARLDTPLQYLERPARDTAVGALVLLHGRGADENDLFPLIDMLDPAQHLLGLSFRAPLSLPPGGWHWYVVETVGAPHTETFAESFKALSEALDALPDTYGIPYDRVVLGGFSQGAVMSLALALGRGRPRPAGVMALSGFVPTVQGFDVDPQNVADLPVMLAHGANDPVIDVSFGRSAAEQLRALGADLDYQESRVGHTIDPSLLNVLPEWLEKTLPSPG